MFPFLKPGDLRRQGAGGQLRGPATTAGVATVADAAECETRAATRRARDTPVASIPHQAAPPSTDSPEPALLKLADAVRRLHPQSAGHEDIASCAGRRAGGGGSFRQTVP